MKLSAVKHALENLEKIAFKLPEGHLVPRHFHVTEVGKVYKHFVDCGGTLREEEVVNFQLWSAEDYDHRLHPEKLLHIIELSQKVLEIGDLDVEVEYQGATIGQYGLDFDGKDFLLTTKNTACLAQDQCGIPQQKPRLRLSDLQSGDSCDPKTGCC